MITPGIVKKIVFSGILLCFSCFAALAQVQEWQWAESGNGNSAESAASVVTDTSGNIYVAGYFNSDSIFFGDTLLVSHGNDDIFLSCYDTYGNIVWAKCFGGTENDYAAYLAADNSGNIYLVGNFGSDTIFFGSEFLISAGYDDIFIVKISSSGSVVWAESFGGSGYDWGLGITCDINNSVYITGLFDSDTITFGSSILLNSGSDDIFVAKLDNFGNIIWALSAGSSQADVGTRLKTNINGDVFLSGYFRSSYMVLGSDTLYNSGGSDPFIAKLNSSGNFLWANSLKGNDNDFIRGLAVSDADEIFIDGSFFSDTLIIGSSLLVNHGGNDVFLSKFDSSGNPLWAKSTGGTDWDLAMGIALDTFDNVYVCGHFRSPSIVFGTTTLTNSGASNIFLVKYNLNGSVEWAKKAGGTYSDIASDVSTDIAGNIYLVGDFSSGTIAFGSNMLTNAGLADVYLAKMTSEYNEIHGIENESFIFNIFPNPSTGHAVITFSLFAESIVDINVYNMLGERSAAIVNEKSFSAGTYFSTSDLPNGIYCITIGINGKRASKLLVVQ